MAGTLTPSWFLYFTDSTGAPLSGGKVYTYVTGTSTPTTVYQDAALLTPWSNPIILPADGKVTVYQGPETIKAVVYNSQDVLQDTYDPIASTALSSSLGGAAFTFGGNDFYPVTNTSYPSGTTVATLHPGSSFFTIDSNDLVGTYQLQGMLQAGASETVSAGLFNLSDGAPDTPLVQISSSDNNGELQASSAITFAAGGTAKTYAVKTKTDTGTISYVWSLALVRTA